MIVYLVRHGEAVPEDADPKRPLSAKGRNEVEGTARELKDEGAKVDEIWHSEKLRAKQTAQIIARDLGVSRVIEKTGLKPDDPVEPIAEMLREASRVTPDAQRNSLHPRPTHNVLIVGHLPFIPKLVQLLKPELGKIKMKTGGFIRISL